MKQTVLGSTVSARREHLSLGLREAARVSGVSHATLSRVEKGEEPDINTFAKLCSWLQLSPTLFLNDNGLR